MKIAIYLRVSTDQQSFDSQKADLLEYCQRRNWIPTIYEDQVSGAKSSRPGLDSLMSDVRLNRVSHLLCFKLDRLGRSLSHFALIMEELLAHRVSLIIPSQGIDTTDSNPANRLQISILMAVAQFERELIRERVLAGQQSARLRGVHLGRKSSHSIPKSTVQSLKSQGHSLRSISRQFNLSISSVQHILSYVPKSTN